MGRSSKCDGNADVVDGSAAAVLFKPRTSEKAENIEWPASEGVIGDNVNRPPGMMALKSGMTNDLMAVLFPNCR